jgi:hypothetical protein
MKRNSLTAAFVGLAALVLSACTPAARAEKKDCYDTFEEAYEADIKDSYSITISGRTYNFRRDTNSKQAKDAILYDVTFIGTLIEEKPENIAEAFNAAQGEYPVVTHRNIVGEKGSLVVPFPGSVGQPKASGFGYVTGSGYKAESHRINVGDTVSVAIDICNFTQFQQRRDEQHAQRL